jgi:HTH-type transcriptional regulator, cell division transcriptional repressor
MPNKNTKRVKRRHINKFNADANMVGKRVLEIRSKAKPPITQDDLVGRLAALGILLNRTAIAKIEAGTRSVKDFEIIALAKALKVPINDLYS